MFNKILKKYFYKKTNKNKLNQKTYLVIPNLKKDKKDSRDHELTSTNQLITPPQYNFKQHLPPVKNQENIGSCTSHAYTTALETIYNMKNDPIQLSELYHYYKGRELSQTLPKYSGITLRDGAKTLHQHGVCFENLHPYNTQNINQTPSLFAQIMARPFRIKNYTRLNNTQEIRQAISQNQPVILGLRIGNKFLNNKGETIQGKENTLKLGHAIMAYGYDTNTISIINTWGIFWGRKGHANIHDTYINEYMIDCWTITK